MFDNLSSSTLPVTQESTMHMIKIRPTCRHYEKIDEDLINQVTQFPEWIEKFSISHNTYSEEAFSLLLSCMSACPRMSVLSASKIFDNWDDSKDIDRFSELCKLIEISASLSVLKLSKNGLPGHTMDMLASSVSAVSRLQVLNLDSNHIGEIGASIIRDCLEVPNLQVFSMENNNLGDPGIAKLSGFLSTVKSLSSLNLAKNAISRNGLKVLCKNLKHTRKLVSLDLSDNDFNHRKCGELFMKAFKYTSKLAKANLQDCMLGNRGSKGVIMGIIKFCPRFTDLNLAFNDIDSSKICQIIYQFLEQNAHAEVKNMKNIDLTGNVIDLYIERNKICFETGKDSADELYCKKLQQIHYEHSFGFL